MRGHCAAAEMPTFRYAVRVGRYSLSFTGIYEPDSG
jgi:hypothetical protein